MVCREYAADGIVTAAAFDESAGYGERAGGIAAAGFTYYVLCGDVRQRLTGQLQKVCGGYDKYPFGRDQAFETVGRVTDEAFPFK